MSLRMRRVAAGSCSEPAGVLSGREPVVLRLGGQSFELPCGARLLAGRATECQIPLGDRLCSRRHAVFTRSEDGEVSVRDLDSSNGTYVNGVRLQATHSLSRGDWITLGNETLELCVAAGAQQGQAPTIPAGPRGGNAKRARGPETSAAHARAKTDPGSPLLSLARIAALAGESTPAPGGAGDVRAPLDELVRRVERGEALSEADARVATLVALHMAKSTTEVRWLSYGLRLYTALRLPWHDELLERLRELQPRLRPERSPECRAQLAALEQAGAGQWNERQRRNVALLRELCEPLLLG